MGITTAHYDDDDFEFSDLKGFITEIGSTVLLGIILAGYAVGGAYIFIYIERDLDRSIAKTIAEHSQQMEREKNDLVDLLWTYSEQSNKTIELLLKKHHDNISNAMKHYRYYGEELTEADTEDKWNMFDALIFTISTLTTIGYGHLTPKTDTGQWMMIIYTVFGLPIMFIFLSRIGDWMARLLKSTFACCCSSVRKRRIREREKQKRHEQDKKRKASHNKTVDFDDIEAMDAYVDEMVDDQMELLMEEEADFDVPMSVSILVICLYLAIGAIIFQELNGWSFVKSLYFCFVSLSTIGFGDLLPTGSENKDKRHFKLIAGGMYTIIGLAVLSMAFNLMMGEMIIKMKWFRKKIGLTEKDEAET